jgi:transcriptional regulator with XRE-family HTH domain
MSDGDQGKSAWARYIKAATERPSWNVAKLARQSGIHRATIFRWMKGEGGNVTVDSVRRIAFALGDDPDAALRVAGDLVSTPPPPADDQDEEITLIMRAPVDDDLKQDMVRRLRERRERERQARIADLQDMIDVAKRSE